MRYRESRLVERDAGERAEHGLGVAHRAENFREAATGAPVIAPECVGTLKGFFCEGGAN